MSAVLDPCKHCGGQAEAHRYGVPVGAKYSVSCKSCPVATDWMHGEDEPTAKARAIAAWNRRPAPQGALTDALPEPAGWLYGNTYWERDNPRLTDHIKQHGRPLYAQQCIEARNQQGDAARGRFVTEFGAWHRYLGKTYLAVEVTEKADLSCLAFRRDALDAAIEQRKANKKGGA